MKTRNYRPEFVKFVRLELQLELKVPGRRKELVERLAYVRQIYERNHPGAKMDLWRWAHKNPTSILAIEYQAIRAELSSVTMRKIYYGNHDENQRYWDMPPVRRVAKLQFLLAWLRGKRAVTTRLGVYGARHTLTEEQWDFLATNEILREMADKFKWRWVENGLKLPLEEEGCGQSNHENNNAAPEQRCDVEMPADDTKQ